MSDPAADSDCHPSPLLEPPDPALLDEVADKLSEAERVLFITGAGISAEAGLPTYRGLGGLYEGKLTEFGIPIEDCLSGEMFQERPEITWKFLSLLEERVAKVAPTPGHRALAALQRYVPQAFVLTQNIDGLHQAAGTRDVIEIHGNVHRLRCQRCGEKISVFSYQSLERPSVCHQCEGSLRPDVILFGEALPREALARLQRENHYGYDLVFSIGTSGAFPYIVEPLISAARSGIPTVEINPIETDLSHFISYRFAAGASATLMGLIQRLNLNL